MSIIFDKPMERAIQQFVSACTCLCQPSVVVNRTSEPKFVTKISVSIH